MTNSRTPGTSEHGKVISKLTKIKCLSFIIVAELTKQNKNKPNTREKDPVHAN